MLHRAFSLALVTSALVLGAVACAPPAGQSGRDGDAAKKGQKAEKREDKPKAEKRAKDVDDDEEEDGISERQDPSRGYVPTQPAADLVFSDAQTTALLAAARAGCDGKPAPAPGPGLLGIKTSVIAVVYDDDGKRIRSKRIDDGENVSAAAHSAGSGVCVRDSDRKGFVHLLVVTKHAHILNFGIKGIFDNKVFEPQVTGLVYNVDGRRFELDPLEMLERNMGPSDTRTAMAKGIGIDAGQVPNRIDLTLELYRTAHVGEAYPTKAPTRFFRGHKVLSADDVNHDLLLERLKLIGQWYKNNVIDGEVTYTYIPTRKVYTNHERTMIRSTITTMVLNRLAVFLGDKELEKKGEEVIAYYFERYFNMGQSKQKGSLVPSTKPLSNGNTVQARWTVAGFIAAACLERTDSERYRTEMDLLMNWGMSHQRSDGVIWTPSGGEQYFMPGQFLLPVTYFYRKTKDKKYKEFVDKAFAVYAPNLYNTMAFGPEWHQPYAPAWFTMPLTQMYLEDKDPAYRDLIFAINDRVVLAYENNARHQVYPDYDGMLAPKPLSMGNNSVTAAALESLADAAITAKAAGDMERFRRYQKVIKRTTAFLLRLQYVPENTYYIVERDRVVGGFKNDMVNTKMWMDSVWHLTSAFIKIQDNRLLDP
jgi:hypothetical protein